MIETNIQQQQQGSVSQQSSLPIAQSMVETGPKVTCALCHAVYAASPQQVPFLRYAQGALEATFMGMCHFCFRCRRAACPQCWDDVHGVCGACVQDAGLPFRAAAAPVDGLIFPPISRQSPALPSPQQQTNSLLVLVRNGRFSPKMQDSINPARTGADTDPAVQPVLAPSDTNAPVNAMMDSQATDIPVSTVVTRPTKTPLLETSQETDKQEVAPRATKTIKKASRLEVVLTWIVLVIVLALVVVIALAEFFPAINALVLRVTHIDIHAEIAYLVHKVQQLFKK